MSTNSKTKKSSGIEAWCLLLITLFFLSVIIVQIIGLPTTLGKHVPAMHLELDHAWATFISISVTFAIFLLPVDRQERFSLVLIWLAKCFVGLVGMLWYENHYSFLDSYSYFQDGQHYLANPEPLSFGDGTFITTYLSAVVSAALPGEYHVLKQVFSIFGLVGTYLFYKSLTIFSGRENTAWLLGFGLFPSILFWGSTLGKDPIVFMGIGLFFYGSARAYRHPSATNYLLLLMGIAIAASIRPWLALIMSPAVVWLVFKSRIDLILKLLALSCSLILIAASATSLAGRMDFASRQDAVEKFDAAARGWASDGDSGQQIKADLTNPAQYILFLPEAIFSTLYRPLPGELGSAFGLMSGVENLLLLVLTIICFLRVTQHDFKVFSVQFSLVFLACWLLLYSPIAYQNLGTAVRFKLQILPPLIALLFYIARKR
jgi:hypothetical protein